MRPRRLTAVVVAALVALGACSSDDDAGVVTGAGDTEQTAPGDEAPACRTGDEARDEPAPDLEAPTGPADELEVTDLIEGCGDPIAEGEPVEVVVNYLGKAHSTGDIFDSTWDRNTPIEFPIGTGRLIDGWEQGMVGMREGGRRVLLVPGDLAYGPAGNPPRIGPDDTLAFVIDLLEVTA